MSPFEIAAIIGAAAWVPQIAILLHRWLSRPQVQFVPERLLELGYTFYGPLVNVRAAISVSRKDAIVERMEVRLLHETGRAISLSWATLNETFSELRSATGETVEVGKRQPAIALKLSTLTLIEKFIGFQDSEFQERQRELVTGVQNYLYFLRRNQENPVEALLRSEPFAELGDFFRHNFAWQTGVYSMDVKVFLAGLRQPAVRRWYFSLASTEIDKLHNNVPEVCRFLEDVATDFKREGEERTYSWQWVNPVLYDTNQEAARRLVAQRATPQRIGSGG